MPDAKSPAELESQARQPLPITPEPASSPAALENQMRRAPAISEPAGLAGLSAPPASTTAPLDAEIDSATTQAATGYSSAPPIAPEPPPPALDEEPLDPSTSEQTDPVGSSLAASPQPANPDLHAGQVRVGADDTAPFVQHPATSPAMLEAQTPVSMARPAEGQEPDLADAAEPTSQQLHGDIDSGRTGDKAPGFDPAAAPMNTDAEAGGAPPSGAEVAQARQAEQQPAPKRPNAVAPELTPDGTSGRRHLWLGVLAGAALAAIVGWILFVLV